MLHMNRLTYRMILSGAGSPQTLALAFRTGSLINAKVAVILKNPENILTGERFATRFVLLYRSCQ